MPTLTGAIVSRPMTQSVSAGASAALSFSVTSGPTVVYVALLPGTMPKGVAATISDARTASQVSAAIVDGGFDPVAVAAGAGDTLRLDIQVSDGSGPLHFALPVPATRPPVVVRTEPPPKKRDVALNTSIVVVFSEPIDGKTVTAQTVRLLTGGQQVSGRPVLAPDGLRVEFRPDQLLAGNTPYTLVVTIDVADLSGDRLEQAVSVDFTTSPPPPVASVVVGPSTVVLARGDTLRLTATSKDAAGIVLTGRAVVWSSNDSAVATVSPAGLVTGVKVGSATVTALVEQQRGSATVRVDTTGTTGALATITVTPNLVTLPINGTQQFTAVGRDAGGKVVAFSPTWSVNNGVGTISSSGLLTAGTVPRVFEWAVSAYKDGEAWGYATVTVTREPSAGLSFTTVTAGGQHTCVVTTGGAAYCWGDNTHGALGNGTMAGSSTPVAVTLGLPFYELSAGGSHTCGTTPSPYPDNYVTYCWGGNASGQLGDGTTVDRPSPQAVDSEGVIGAIISSGGNHTCVLDLWAIGLDLCWGANDGGQLDDGTTVGKLSPVSIKRVNYTPFETVSAGRSHTCAEAGGLNYPSFAWYCWGANGNGQLGDGTTTDRTSWALPVGGGMMFAVGGVSAGERHTCGISGLAAYCWGLNSSGQLGDGTTTQRTSPALVAGGLSFVQVSAGGSHTCGITATGAAYCWGANDHGQLGDGTTTQQLSPAPVAGGLTFAVPSGFPYRSTISAGRSHTCGITIAGATYCWGSNSNGQLGNGSTTDSAVPVRVAGPP